MSESEQSWKTTVGFASSSTAIALLSGIHPLLSIEQVFVEFAMDASTVNSGSKSAKSGNSSCISSVCSCGFENDGLDSGPCVRGH